MDERSRGGEIPVERLLEELDELKHDSAALADLRHGLSRAEEHRAWPRIAPWCDLRSEPSRRIVLTVAAGYAFHGRSVRTGKTLGAVLRTLARAARHGDRGSETFDARFQRLLACASVVELCDQLGGLLRAAALHRVPVDFARLYQDLRGWGEATKVEWAQEYWGETPGAAEGAETKVA